MRLEGQVSTGGGRSFGCLRLNCAASLQVGGAHFKRISVSPRACSLGKFLNLTPLKWLDGNAFKTSIVYGETYTFSNKTRRHKKKPFLRKTHDTTTTILQTVKLV